jgi:predicted unusual protein kinase regulating ubiquinone biosynthesis (AarF/ABC1/UbiB family)
MRRAAAVLAALGALAGVAGAAGATRAVTRRRGGPGRSAHPVLGRARARRNLEVARLGARVGRRYATTSARKVFASAARRAELDRERELRTAADVAATLGQMKGALMKLGQMASYLDEGLPEPLRLALSQLRAEAPPMAPELAAEVVERELGRPPEAVFVTWDPVPIAAASIGQVHRALWRDPATGAERAVAVKVQYPGVAEAIEADLANADLLGAILAQGFKGLDPGPLVAELRARIVEELDYRREAADQARFAAWYEGHPFVHVPGVVDACSGATVLTTDLATGATWEELQDWPQHEKDAAAETIYRFVFRSLYSLHAFNGDPHPGNYLFRPGGHVTFLDFGLVKHFTDDEMARFQRMITHAVIRPDWAAFRREVEEAGLLRPGAPVSTEEAGAYFEVFYESVREHGTHTWTPEYASRAVRQVWDRSSPIAPYATVPPAFVIIQRINMGLYAILGQLRATGNFRAIAEELWPMVQGPPSTAMGVAEADWLARHHPGLAPH